ncbi:hypothetical protein KL915_003954 [Ogataea haglerorum]|nr:hypothetical protein KL915_003954 [Ogataea haglerorum]
MKAHNILALAAILASVNAVYPPVTGDKSISDADLVTIQVTQAKDDKKLDQHLESLKADATKGANALNAEAELPRHSEVFFMSTSMIVVSEIGDKTFLVAALMAMKHPRMVVFSSALAALAFMTILSGVVGHVLPSLIPHRLTQFLAGVLFVIFGVSLLKEGMAMSKNAGIDEELAEVEEEIEVSTLNQRSGSLEEAAVPGAVARKPIWKEGLSHVSNLASYILSPVWVQTFAMTFLGEWGDRSQIATIAMAAGSDYWMVILGGVVGHALCTGMAVIGGQLLATKISMRSVTLGGAIAFFIFSVLYFYNAYYDIES